MPAWAHDYSTGSLRIIHPWSNASPPGAPGVGYMVILNEGSQPDKLVSVSADFAQVSAHKTTVKDGMVQMTPMTDGVEIPANASVSFEPGGLHLMLMNLSTPLRSGEERPITLEFEKAGSISVNFKVMGMGDGEAMDHGN
ncbi:copper chaperone PCu(A)C [Saccharospirillum alexandrii]|uniref:copper chaperone PCu(A)C n=1 Tax=Saccharospirillum alexandrii TaxID=2448477 RepID=UPI002482F2FF|nr:copper chaperone PCu(A)C [Saccharospirillum alexandrii]